MKILKFLAPVVIISLLITSCFTTVHTVGSGASGGESVSKKQWFILWGLVPINTPDSKAMANGATNYTIKTEESFIDGVITLFTAIVTVSPRTITVTK